jgi:hypothetical protein
MKSSHPLFRKTRGILPTQIAMRMLLFLFVVFLSGTVRADSALNASSTASPTALSLQKNTASQTATAHLQHWVDVETPPSLPQWQSRDGALWGYSDISKHWGMTAYLRLSVANTSNAPQHYVIDARQVRKNKAAFMLVQQAPLHNIDSLYTLKGLHQPLISAGPNLFELTLPAQSIALVSMEYASGLEHLPQITLWKKNAFNAARNHSDNLVFFLAGILIAYFLLAAINALGTKQYISLVGALFAGSAIFSNHILLNHIMTLSMHSVNTTWLTYSAAILNLVAFVAIIVWLMPRSRHKELLNKTQWLIVFSAAMLLPLAIPHSTYAASLLTLSLVIALASFAVSAFRYVSDHRYSAVMMISGFKALTTLTQLGLIHMFAAHIVSCFSYIFYAVLLHTFETTMILSLVLYLVRKEQDFLSQAWIEVAKEEQKIATLSPLIHASRHDLRAPLSDIIGLSDLVADNPLDQSQRENIYAIQNVAKTALEKINLIFSYNNPLNKPLASNLSQFRLTSLVSECSGFYSYLFKEHDNELIINFSNTVPDQFEGDQDTLRQILLHILEQFALQQETTNCHIFFEYSNAVLRIQCDTPQLSLLSKVFDNSSKPLLLRKLVAKANGSIELSNTRQNFILTIPLQTLATTDTSVHNNTLTKGKQVLVIDDNPAACSVIASYLERWNIHAHIAHNLTEAQAIVSHQNTIGSPINLLIIDYLLDDINGIELLDVLLQTTPSGLTAPVILMSNALDLIDMDEAQQRDIHHVLEKPVMPETLHAAVVESFHLQQTLDNSRPISTANGEQTFNPNLEKSVLIVEDNPIGVKILCALLDRFLASYDIAKTAEQALEFFNRNHYDVVLLDCQLPDASGFSVAQQMRQIEAQTGNKPDTIVHHTQAIIIGVSADSASNNKKQALEQGMNHYFEKPVTHEQLEKFFTARH